MQTTLADPRFSRVDRDSMPGMLRWNAVHRPNEIAVICATASVTWAELDSRSDLLAIALAGLGLKREDRLGVMMKNCLEYLEIYQAAAKSGVVVVPINVQLKTAEVRYILSDSGARAVIIDPDSASEDRSQAFGSLPIVTTGGEGATYEELLTGAEHRALPPRIRTGLFFQGYTSGTTGRPKGCLQRAEVFVEHYHLSNTLYRHGQGDVMLIPGPLFHEAPTLFSLAQLFFGGTVVLLPRFDPDEALQTIERERCTTVGFAVPVMLDRLCEVAASYDISSVKRIITAGAPLHESTRLNVLASFPGSTLDEFYGGTEIGIITNIEHRSAREKGAAVGRPVNGISALVLDEHDEVAPVGEVGQVFVTPVMMAGYHNLPEATASATRTFGEVTWMTLGDLGQLDEEGYLYLVDRRNDLIISGGENVYPTEVEDVLEAHPDISELAVIGLPDARWGQSVTVVVVSDAENLTLEEIRAFCADKLAGYKTPKRLIRVDSLPRTASGKIMKHELRAQLAGSEGSGPS